MLLEELFPLFERYTDVVDALLPYAHDPDIYITFTQDVGTRSHNGRSDGSLPLRPRNATGAKLGINPRSRYDTPVGIYTYPLREIWDDLERNSIPYAGEQPFVHVVRAAVPVQELGEMSEQQFKDALTKLHEWYGGKLKFGEFGFDRTMAFAAGQAAHSSWGGKFWNVTRIIANEMPNKWGKSAAAWTAILRRLGYKAFSDKRGLGIIHTNEPVQAVFLEKTALRLVETIRNVRKETPREDTKELISTPWDIGQIVGYETGYKTAWMSREWMDLIKNGESEHFEVDEPSKFYYLLPSQLPHVLANIVEARYQWLPQVIGFFPSLTATPGSGWGNIPQHAWKGDVARLWQATIPRNDVREVKHYIRHAYTPTYIEFFERNRPNDGVTDVRGAMVLNTLHYPLKKAAAGTDEPAIIRQNLANILGRSDLNKVVALIGEDRFMAFLAMEAKNYK